MIQTSKYPSFYFSSFTQRIDFLIICCLLPLLEANYPVDHQYHLCSSLQAFVAAALGPVLVGARSLGEEEFGCYAFCHLFPVFRFAF